MDFDRAAERLAKDHSKLRRARRRNNTKGLQVSSKAQKETEYRKRQYELKKQQQALQKQKEYAGKLLMQKCHAKLSHGSINFENKTFSECTSIHGEGDKITLPPSTLQDLSQLFIDNSNNNNKNPMYFRVGILNPNYSFPASQGMKEYMEQQSTDTKMVTDNEDSDNDDDGDENDDGMTSIYLEELSHQYYTYTHATVVEFTQEEGCIGLPRSISSALLDSSRLLCHRSKNDDNRPLIPFIPHTQTLDPSLSAKEENAGSVSEEMMDLDDENSNDNNHQGTAGHVAYGAFHVPNLPVEITLLSSLPKGRKCTLRPTTQAIQDGFYNLKDVKLVLEQSLIRTRATLTFGDEISTWHRGKKYNLNVTQLEPSYLGVVSCINTDLEVDFAAVASDDVHSTSSVKPNLNSQRKVSRTKIDNSDNIVDGYRLGGNIDKSKNIDANENKEKDINSLIASTTITKVELPPEPPVSTSSNGDIIICTIQIRSFDGSKDKRRFDLKTNTLKHVFDFASNLCGLPSNNFRLVKRFPRQIFETPYDSKSMEDLNFGKQEMIFIERI